MRISSTGQAKVNVAGKWRKTAQFGGADIGGPNQETGFSQPSVPFEGDPNNEPLVNNVAQDVRNIIAQSPINAEIYVLGDRNEKRQVMRCYYDERSNAIVIET